MTTDLIKQKLNAALNPSLLEIQDNSAAHAGHSGNQKGGGHYHVIIVSTLFEGQSPVQRRQLVFQALGDMMKHDIHALGIEPFTSSEHLQR
jgi:BolA protein